MWLQRAQSYCIVNKSNISPNAASLLKKKISNSKIEKEAEKVDVNNFFSN